MEDLIKRLEAAEVGSRELDCRVVAWAEGVIGGEHWSDNDLEYAITDPDRTCNPEHVTTSLDAALALAERVGWRAYMADFSIVNNFSWMLKSLIDISVTCTESGEHYTGPDFKSGRGKTPSLALCIAILRAKQIDTAQNPR